MIDPTKKYRPYEGESVAILDPAVDGGAFGLWKGSGFEYTTVYWNAKGECFHQERFRAGDLIEVPEEVTVRKNLLHSLLPGCSPLLIDASNQYSGPADRLIGTIDITHNGKELLKCEIVK